MSENKKNTTLVKKEEKKGMPFLSLLGIIFMVILGLLLGILLGTIAFRALTRAVVANIVPVSEPIANVQEVQPVANDNVVTSDKEVVATSGTIGSDADGSYFPEFSCSHLESCQISEVPEGYFTIGFTDNGDGCDWVLFDEGESIDYEGLDEFHTYNNLLPLTGLEGFVASQFQYVLTCHH